MSWSRCRIGLMYATPIRSFEPNSIAMFCSLTSRYSSTATGRLNMTPSNMSLRATVKFRNIEYLLVKTELQNVFLVRQCAAIRLAEVGLSILQIGLTIIVVNTYALIQV